MSGPKVVRVITKQELMAICQGRIYTLRDAINEWRSFAIRHDALNKDEEKEIVDRFSSITRLFELERYKDVQNQCITEIAFLKRDLHRIQEQAIAKAENEKTVRRRLKYSAETLIQAFETSGRLIPHELQTIVTSVETAQEAELSSMGSAFNQILTEYTLNITNNHNITPLQAELSKKLAEGEKLQTLAEWKTTQVVNNSSEDADRRLDKLITEIEVLESKEIAKPFLDRAALITKIPSSSHRSLLIDSLIFDLVAHSAARKEKEKEIAAVRELRSELRSFSSKSVKDLEALITQAINSQDFSSCNILKERATKLLDEEKKALAGTARRKAILQGLAELGYEIRENMVTAWAENGRIVVKKPNENVYGVELGAIADAERIQIQLVSFEQSEHSASKASKERDRETIWCSEFSHLELLLQKSGTTLKIEKALPVGAKALKSVSMMNTKQDNQLKIVTTLQQKKKD